MVKNPIRQGLRYFPLIVIFCLAPIASATTSNNDPLNAAPHSAETSQQHLATPEASGYYLNIQRDFKNLQTTLIGEAPEFRMSSQQATQELQRLMNYLRKLFRYMPDSSAWPGTRMTSNDSGVDVFMYSPEDGGGPWNNSRHRKTLKADALLNAEEEVAVAKVIQEDFKVNVEFLTNEATMNELNRLPLNAHVQLLRLQTRTALFLLNLQNKKTPNSALLAVKYQELKSFLILESDIPHDIARAKYEALGAGYTQAKLMSSGGLANVPDPTQYDFITVLELEKSFIQNQDFEYVAPYTARTTTLIAAYQKQGFQIISLAGPEGVERHFAVVKGSLAGYRAGSLGLVATEPLFPVVKFGPLGNRYVDNPGVTFSTDIDLSFNSNPRMIFIRPLTSSR